MNWYLKTLASYATIEGRARRTEFWLFNLFNMCIFALLSAFEVISGIFPAESGGILVNGYSLFVFIPSVAVSIRRMHDINCSGWWVLVPVIPVFMAMIPGTVGENRFGPDPKDRYTVAA